MIAITRFVSSFELHFTYVVLLVPVVKWPNCRNTDLVVIVEHNNCVYSGSAQASCPVFFPDILPLFSKHSTFPLLS